ncbi:MAG TPA: hypothetical protein VF458_19850 [Ktedonobacteraceae bacterium]
MMMDFREQRRIARAQRRAYRRQQRYRNHSSRVGGMIIWPLAFVLFIITHSWVWVVVAVCALIILAATYYLGTLSNRRMDQPQRNNQPIYQQREQPAYQPYTQGYTPRPAHPQPEIYQEGSQQYQYPSQQQQQYEEPMTMYPEE